MQLSIVIPTWKRVPKLTSCLASLEAQTCLPDQVLITTRPEDSETNNYLLHWLPQTKLNVKIVSVTKPGVIYAENQAISLLLKESSSDIVTFMDDDAIAFPHWVEKIKHFFKAHPEAAALGGPDIILSEPWTYHDIHKETVGKLTTYGKVIGNHHHKSSGLRQVDALKGVNMSVRRSCLQPLNSKLQGDDPAKGNGVFWELDLCLNIKKKGGRIYFDPDLLIHHDSNHSHFIANSVISSTSHNLTLVLMEQLSWPKKILFLSYSILIGNGHVRGLAKTAYSLVKEKKAKPLQEFYHSMNGLFSGLGTWLS